MAPLAYSGKVFEMERDAWRQLVEGVRYSRLYAFDARHTETCESAECGCGSYLLTAARLYARTHAVAHAERARLAAEKEDALRGEGGQDESRAGQGESR